MKTFVVITSINPPTSAVKAFVQNTKVSVILVADKKTPLNWHEPDVHLLSLQSQRSLNYQIIKHLPFNHYSRKMIGYLYAAKEGAEVIADADDDNIPDKNYSFPKFDGTFQSTKPNLGFINVYRYFSNRNIWPRGLPLKSIRSTFDMDLSARKKESVGIWQGLANLDPDVDAIYRLTSNEPCIFKKSPPVVLQYGTISPINSQNTCFRKELFPLLYLPTTVEFRFTDILRGLVAQPIMWATGYKVGFTNANVVQQRNFHDYFEDFKQEVNMYLNIPSICELIVDQVCQGKTIMANLADIYYSLYRAKFVKKKELVVLEKWLHDLYTDNGL